jgi:FkbM family methyltransferase
MIKEFIKSFCRSFGLELKQYNIQNSENLLLKRCTDYFQIDLIIDVGANVGQYATAMRSVGYSKQLISFEPLAKAFGRLATVASNDSAWEVFNLGLGSSQQELTINVSENLASSSFLSVTALSTQAEPLSQFSGTQKVNVVRLDHFLKERINNFENVFLKIDVQGFELEVLKGAEGILKNVKAIQLEMSFVPLYVDGPLYSDILFWIERNGFEVYSIIPGFRNLESGQLLQADGIFTRTRQGSI